MAVGSRRSVGDKPHWRSVGDKPHWVDFLAFVQLPLQQVVITKRERRHISRVLFLCERKRSCGIVRSGSRRRSPWVTFPVHHFPEET